MKRKAFTLIEVMLGVFFLTIALLSLLWLNQSSNRGMMDAYHELLAFTIAREPIEVYRSFGFNWLKDFSKHPLKEYPLDKWVDLSDSTSYGGRLPVGVTNFRRFISLENIEADDVKAIKVTVRVQPRQATWLSRNEVALQSVISEQPL